MRLRLLISFALALGSMCYAQPDYLYGYWLKSNGDGTFQAMYFSEQNHCYVSGIITTTEDLKSQLLLRYDYKVEDQVIVVGRRWKLLDEIQDGKHVLRETLYDVRGPSLHFWEMNYDSTTCFYKIKDNAPVCHSPEEWLVSGGEWYDDSYLTGYPGWEFSFKNGGMFTGIFDDEPIINDGKYFISDNMLKLWFDDKTVVSYEIDRFCKAILGLYQRNNKFYTNLVSNLSVRNENYLYRGGTDGRILMEVFEGKLGAAEYVVFSLYPDYVSLCDMYDKEVYNKVQPDKRVKLAIRNGYELYNDAGQKVARGSAFGGSFEVTSDRNLWFLGQYTMMW